MGNRTVSVLAALFAVCSTVSAAEYHVAGGRSGSGSGSGSVSRPYRTISEAARRARPGDIITVHEGIYRERVNPPRGGTSDRSRITYRAAPGERVVITGAEPAKGWTREQNDTWKLVIPNGFFGDFNPYSDTIRGDWFKSRGRKHHTGAIYIDEGWLIEARKLEDVLAPARTGGKVSPGTRPGLWFATVDDTDTTIWAQFPGADPNRARVEINTRQTVFYPDKPGRGYITVRGFILERAATPWAPPTAEQKGLIGTHWSKGWIIEDCVISHSKCVGVTLGKYGDEWDNKSQSADAYNKTIKRALANGWTREAIGSHIVRNNRIHNCEQAGIVGSMGGVFSTISGNEIHDIHVHRLFAGWEMAGIKIHAPIDMHITDNHIYRCIRGMWLDWMSQGTRVSRNVIHDCGEDIWMEVNHGPYVIDNNVLLSRTSLKLWSQGGAFIHNIVAGKVSFSPQGRRTPYHKPHSTEVVSIQANPTGDDRYYNNIFVGKSGLTVRGKGAKGRLPVFAGGNVYLKGFAPCASEQTPPLVANHDPKLQLLEENGSWYLTLNFDAGWRKAAGRRMIDSSVLGVAKIPNVPFEALDRTPLTFDTDYFGVKRDAANPFPGAFERVRNGLIRVKVWPKAPRDVK